MAQPRFSYQWLQEVWILKFGGGKIEGRHILIIALSEHHVDYMNRKGWSLRYYAEGGGGGHFHRCVYRIA